MAPDYVIIGAGFAGLSAAVRLAREGARVVVLESRTRLGGRATAFVDRETGELVDNGQHVLLGCYRETFAFLREIGAMENVRMQPALSVTMIDRSGRRSRLACPSLPSPLHLLAGVMDWDALAWRDRLSVLRMATPLRLAKRELRWDPLAVAALNQAPDRAAAPTFARVLAEMFGEDPQSAAIALPTQPLHLMYAEPARTYLERRGGTVRTGAQARLHISNDRLTAVEAAGERWNPSAVISSVPWFALPDLVNNHAPALSDIIDRAQRMESSPIVTVNLWFDRAVMNEPFIGLPGRPMQWVFDKRTVFGAEASHLSLVSSGASPLVELANRELIALAHDGLLDAMPETRAARLRRATVIREPRATFSLAPGQPRRPATETPVRGLYLAGDWIETGLPATIESAVRSGHSAAEALRSSR
jgi:squalene-associated FAD-dependent desaturase